MTGELAAYSICYYRLSKLFSEQNERFQNLLQAAPPYTGQSSISDLDVIITSNRKVQAAKAKADKTFKDLTETGHTILKMMQYFEIPPRTVLTGEIPGELEYEIWANENDDVFIGKIRDLPQEAVNPNVIVIKCWNGDKTEEED